MDLFSDQRCLWTCSPTSAIYGSVLRLELSMDLSAVYGFVLRLELQRRINASPPLRSEAERGRVRVGARRGKSDGAGRVIEPLVPAAGVRHALTCRRAPTRAPSRAASSAAQGRRQKKTKLLVCRSEFIPTQCCRVETRPTGEPPGHASPLLGRKAEQGRCKEVSAAT